MIKFNFDSFIFILALVILSTPVFCQKKLKVELERKIVLENSDYYLYELNFKVINNHIFYLIQAENEINLYKKSLEDNSEHIFHCITNPEDIGYIYAFDVSKDEKQVVYTLDRDVCLFDIELAEFKNSCAHFDESHIVYRSEFGFDNVSLTDNQINLGTCYNFFIKKNNLDDEIKYCRCIQLDRSSYKLLADIHFEHDAIAFTHLPHNFYDLLGNKVVFTHALAYNQLVYDGNNKTKYKIGSERYLNEDYQSIPFESLITDGVDTKDVIKKASTFAKEIDRIEGTYFLNDTMLVVIEKKSGKNMDSKRILHFYAFDDNNKTWILKTKKSFKNDRISRRYSTLQFYYSSGIQFVGNKLYFSGLDIPLDIKNKRSLERYSNSNFENQKYALYEYTIKL